MSHREVGEQVHSFYQKLHFNEGSDTERDLAVLRSGAVVDAQLMPSFLEELSSVEERRGCLVEAGCGIGWLSTAIGLRFPKIEVCALDFSERALAQAKKMSAGVVDNVKFHQQNLLEWETLASYQGAGALISVGVLHHTGDFHAALTNCLRLLQPGSSAYIGLYHLHRRAPFLEHFEYLKNDGRSAKELRQEYARLDGRTSDPVRQESWFLDQVLHPHETQHTVEEVMRVAGPEFEHIENSITGKQLPAPDRLDAVEKRQRVLGESALKSGRYDPGFFMVHLRKV